jgi:beta-lactamase regulating signal transducer with metallopeptidase domain
VIAAFMLHALGVGVLCAAAAWAAERALAQLGGPRRLAWALGMPASVIVALLALRLPADATVTADLTAEAVTGPIHAAVTTVSTTFMRLPPVQASDSLDRLLAIAWAGLSATVLAAYLLTARRLARRARDWSRLSPAKDDVLLSDDLGPAVFGLWRSCVVLPRWLSAASATTQRLVLAHERQHVAARDPQLLALGLALVTLFPWNLPLVWQLRRMRFALEVDCDARVLADADPADYGEALLTVSQHQTLAPAGAIALIERPSQLERRISIMTQGTQRFSRALALMALGLTAICLLAATSLQAPVLAAADVPLKPTPTGAAALKLGQQFERMLADRFPDALETAAPGSMVVILVNADWSIASAALVTAGRGDIPADERSFGVIGIDKQDVPYVGAMRMQSPKDPAHWLLMLYTERNTPGQRFVSHIFPDNRAVDRQIFRTYFAQAAKSGVPAGEQVWVLLDREGHVLRSGQEPVESSSWTRSLEARFPGIRTEGITVTPITNEAGEPVLDGAGKELHLISVWLAPGSSPPRG